MVTRVEADKNILRWARERSRLTIERAAGLLNCEADFLEKIEQGEQFPHAGLFRRMSDVYSVPEATLLGVVPPVERALPKDFRSFDGTSVDLSYETICAIRAVEARQEALAFLAAIDDAIVSPSLPICSLKDNPEKLGAKYRKELGFSLIDQLRVTPEQAFTKWRVLVEDLGVSVYVEPLGEDESRGVSVYFNDFPAILIDQNEKLAGARSFTLMHEFAHILLRQAGISNFNPRSTVERFCNHFSAAFLMPIQAIEAVFFREILATKEPGIAELSAAATKLCVTISQLALRLEELKIAKTGYFKRISAVLNPPTKKLEAKAAHHIIPSAIRIDPHEPILSCQLI